MVRLVRNLSRVADHGLAPYHSVNNGHIHKSPQIDLLHPLNLVVCVDNEVFYLFGRFWSRSWPFREVSFTDIIIQQGWQLFPTVAVTHREFRPNFNGSANRSAIRFRDVKDR